MSFSPTGTTALMYVPESAVIDLVRQEEVTTAVAAVFKAHAADEAENFPVVREVLGCHDAVFGFKSAFDRDAGVLGVKAGGLWPGNRRLGIANHQSTTLLFHPTTGAPRALIGTTFLTALRTAAASALSIRALARSDARVLGIIGAGGQGEAQALAALGERAFERVLVHDRDPQAAQALVRTLVEHGTDAAEARPDTLCQAADVIITVTPSHSPVLRDEDVRPGTHLACMGADTVGKQEVPTALVARARLFGDEPGQAISIGECQHAYRDGLITMDSIVRIGTVLAGDNPGRLDERETTLFDGTGIALQDLAAAEVALTAAINAGRATELLV